MGAPETIGIFDFTMHGADDIRRPISDISAIILVTQSIFSVLEPRISKKNYKFQAKF